MAGFSKNAAARSRSKIEWTDAKWNPVAGCSKVSKGCEGCYAIPNAWRLGFNPNMAVAKAYSIIVRKDFRGGNWKLDWTGIVRCLPERLDQPLRWKKPRRIFVNSMSDLFHPDVPDGFIDQVFAVMALCPQHVFQVLTKRPERMREYVNGVFPRFRDINEAAREISGRDGIAVLPTQQHGMVPDNWPPPNVWLGVSAEDQKTADERIPHLLKTPAAVRFVSLEPLLGAVDVTPWVRGSYECSVSCGFRLGAHPDEEYCSRCGFPGDHMGEFCPKCGSSEFIPRCPECRGDMVQDHPDTPVLDWVIVGGESGPGARPMHPDWPRQIRDQCVAAGVPFFMKQMSKRETIPADLMIREWPDAR